MRGPDRGARRSPRRRLRVDERSELEASARACVKRSPTVATWDLNLVFPQPALLRRDGAEGVKLGERKRVGIESLTVGEDLHVLAKERANAAKEGLARVGVARRDARPRAELDDAPSPGSTRHLDPQSAPPVADS